MFRDGAVDVAALLPVPAPAYAEQLAAVVCPDDEQRVDESLTGKSVELA